MAATSLTAIGTGPLTGVRKLPDGFMSGCTNLTSVLLPPNVEELGVDAFSNWASEPPSAEAVRGEVRQLSETFERSRRW